MLLESNILDLRRFNLVLMAKWWWSNVNHLKGPSIDPRRGNWMAKLLNPFNFFGIWRGVLLDKTHHLDRSILQLRKGQEDIFLA